MNAYSIRKVLVPIDLSETSLNALDTAIAIVKRHKAILQILNIADPLPGISGKSNARFFSSPTDKNVLSALVGSIQYTHKIKPQFIQIDGHVVERIITTADVEQSDLIIMGTHGASGQRDGYIGTNTYGVIKHSTAPVLAVPYTRKWTSFNKVLFPIRAVTGALDHYSIVCHFLQANSMLDVLGLSLRSLERETGALDKIASEIGNKILSDNLKLRTSWGRGISISEDVIQFAQDNQAELIVLTSILDATDKPGFIGPHTQKIINLAKFPLLSIK